ncbi:hypothetical protein HMPREF9099_01790, partial [Lachnospiraceae bacterium oral taxon 082 str. F0431]
TYNIINIKKIYQMELRKNENKYYKKICFYWNIVLAFEPYTNCFISNTNDKRKQTKNG